MNSCTHGQLARQCEICELEKERDDLRCEVQLAQEQVLSRDAELWGRTQEILKLRAQLAEYQRDAKRYEWLRNSSYVYLREGLDDSGWCPSLAEDIDEAADEAIAAEKEGKK